MNKWPSEQPSIVTKLVNKWPSEQHSILTKCKWSTSLHKVTLQQHLTDQKWKRNLSTSSSIRISTNTVNVTCTSLPSSRRPPFSFSVYMVNRGFLEQKPRLTANSSANLHPPPVNGWSAKIAWTILASLQPLQPNLHLASVTRVIRQGFWTILDSLPTLQTASIRFQWTDDQPRFLD